MMRELDRRQMGDGRLPGEVVGIHWLLGLRPYGIVSTRDESSQ